MSPASQYPFYVAIFATLLGALVLFYFAARPWRRTGRRPRTLAAIAGVLLLVCAYFFQVMLPGGPASPSQVPSPAAPDNQ